VPPGFDLWRSADIWTWGDPIAAPLRADPKQLRSLWMAQVTRALDQCMRSSAFLDGMHDSLAAATRTACLNVWFPFKQESFP
jgi:hypothetical protein